MGAGLPTLKRQADKDRTKEKDGTVVWHLIGDGAQYTECGLEFLKFEDL